MSGFRKARAEQAALKMALYGPPGSGKTFTTLLLSEGLAKREGKRIAFVDTERGTDFYCQAVKERKIHPAGFDFDAIYTRSIAEVLKEVKALDTTVYGVIIIDTMTHIWEAAKAAYGGKQTKIGTIPFQAWTSIKKPYKDIMSLLLSSPAHVFICGRQGTEYATDEETEELKAIGFKMKAEGETAYEPHILLRMEAIKPKQTNAPATIVAYAEKDRTGILSGRSFPNPTFDTICAPLLGLLGSNQARIKSSDEVANDDAEAIEHAEHEFAAQSAELMRTFSARIELCETAAALKKIGDGITPSIKAKMLPSDLAGVREKYHRRMSVLPDNGKMVTGKAASARIEKADEATDAWTTLGAVDETITDSLAAAAQAKSAKANAEGEDWKIDPTGEKAAARLAGRLEERSTADHSNDFKGSDGGQLPRSPIDLGTQGLLDDARAKTKEGALKFNHWEKRLNQKHFDQLEPYLEELRAAANAVEGDHRQ